MAGAVIVAVAVAVAVIVAVAVVVFGSEQVLTELEHTPRTNTLVE